jgi:hypothetical protein
MVAVAVAGTDVVAGVSVLFSAHLGDTPSRFVRLVCFHLYHHLLNPTMVLLVTSDNEQFVVEKDVAERSVLIKNMLEGKSES